MEKYHKIQTVYKRDPATKMKTLLEGEYALPEFGYLAENKWVFTEKIDGTNIRVMWNGGEVVFGGKSDNAQMPVFLLYKLQELFEGTAKKQLFIEQFEDADPLLMQEPLEVCMYGEGYGAKIQKGGGNYIPDGVDFVLFDVRVGTWWLERAAVEEIGVKFGLKVAPILGEGTLSEMIEMTRKGFNSQWGEFKAEGIVARPATELKTRRGDRIITKIKHKDF